MAQKEARLQAAMQAYQTGQISSIRSAAQLYNIPRSTLTNRLAGRTSRTKTRVKSHKLTPIEEQALVE